VYIWATVKRENRLFLLYSVEWWQDRMLLEDLSVMRSNWLLFGILIGLSVIWGLIYWIFIVPGN